MDHRQVASPIQLWRLARSPNKCLTFLTTSSGGPQRRRTRSKATTSAAHGVAMFPPGHADVGEFREVNRVLMSAHRTAVDVLRSSSNAKLGTCLALPLIEPARIDDTGDIEAANDLRETMVDSHLRDLGAGGDVGDFVGLH